VPFGSQSVLVVEDDTGKVLYEKNAGAVVPIASLTKLMTAMVVLDAHQDMNEPIEIDSSDVDMLKHSSSRVPVGATIPRRDVLQLALMSSDNRAAAALGRTYPGGMPAFRAAVKRKIAALGMNQTVIDEPTGLSPHNRSTAADLVKMATAASTYPEITRITTSSDHLINIKGRERRIPQHQPPGRRQGLGRRPVEDRLHPGSGPLPDHAHQGRRQERDHGAAERRRLVGAHAGRAEHPPPRAGRHHPGR
jgi:D-alanyl-D-alanine carboxypeptidase